MDEEDGEVELELDDEMDSNAVSEGITESFVPSDLHCLPTSFMSFNAGSVKDEFREAIGPLNASETEEVVNEQNLVRSEMDPVCAESELTEEQLTPIGSIKKLRGPRNKKTAKSIATLNELSRDTKTKVRKWEHKPVSIKTLEGEFTVMLWTTGMSYARFHSRKYTLLNEYCYIIQFLSTFAVFQQ